MVELLYDPLAYSAIQSLLPEYSVNNHPLLDQIQTRWLELAANIDYGDTFTAADSDQFFAGLADWLLLPERRRPSPYSLEHKNHRVLIRHEALKIYYHEELEIARASTLDYVLGLSIPTDARIAIASHIAQIPFLVEGREPMWTCHEDGSQSITMSPLFDLVEAQETERAFRQQPSVDLLRNVTRKHAGHELGHTIDAFLISIGLETVSGDYGSAHMADFPVQFRGSSNDRILTTILPHTMNERFAEHFGWAAPVNSGLSYNAVVDVARKNLAQIYGLKINPNTLIDIYFGIVEALGKKGITSLAQPACAVKEFLFKVLLPHKLIAQAIPFSRQSMEAMLTAAWQDSHITFPISVISDQAISGT